MKHIFVNLKRFDVPRSKGGLCLIENPIYWAESILEQSIQQRLGCSDLRLTYLFPEGLVAAAAAKLRAYPPEQTTNLCIGCQGVHWEDVQPRGNFGAFTASLPAAAATGLGCTWTIIGHSEERRKILQVLKTYDPQIETDLEQMSQALRTASHLSNAEVKCALRAGLNVLVCIGETAEERGGGSFDEQKPRIRRALADQLAVSLEGVGEPSKRSELVIGYEPVWAIGPGKTPPDAAYIQFVSEFIKEIVEQKFHFVPPVVYGGGLKDENAAVIANISTIDGGLVALTRFTGEIGFEVEDLGRIAARYMAAILEG